MGLCISKTNPASDAQAPARNQPVDATPIPRTSSPPTADARFDGLARRSSENATSSAAARSSTSRAFSSDRVAHDTTADKRSIFAPYADSSMHKRFMEWSVHLQPQNIGVPTEAPHDLVAHFSSPGFRQQNPVFASVPPEECAAIYIHTAQDYELISPLTGQSAPAYRLVNKLLRDTATSAGAEKNALDKAIKELSPYINTVTSGINRLMDVAPYKGTVFRGIRLTPGQIGNFKRLHGSGGEYVDHAFMSTTVDREAAQAFEAGSPNNTAMEIKLRRGAYVNPISQAQSEEEILLPPNCRFKVTGVEEVVLPTEHEPRFIVRLQQVGV